MKTATKLTVALSLLFCLFSVLVTPPLARAGAPDADKYVVLANSANTTEFKDDEAARQEVRSLFLRTSSQWSGKQEAKPFSSKEGEAMYAAFLEDVLEMSKSELARHWITMKNKHGIAPPKEISSSKMMLKYVERFEGGFGIVTVEEAKGTDLRVLFSF